MLVTVQAGKLQQNVQASYESPARSRFWVRCFHSPPPLAFRWDFLPSTVGGGTVCRNGTEVPCAPAATPPNGRGHYLPNGTGFSLGRTGGSWWRRCASEHGRVEPLDV